MAKSNFKLPKKVTDKNITIDGQEVQLNFGLQFACEIDNYREEIAVMQGVDNIILVTSALLERKLGTLIDLLHFSLVGTGVTDEQIEVYLNDVAEAGKLEELFDVFFTNVLACKFLKDKAKSNLTLLTAITNMKAIQKEAYEDELTDLVEEMSTELERAKVLKAEEKAKKEE